MSTTKPKRARMKPGVRPVIVECMLVPEYPTYWTIPESSSAGVALLVEDGQVEYEPAFARSEAGTFAVQTALQPVAPAAPAAGAKPFARKAPRN